MPFPVSLSGNPWAFLQREGHPKVVPDSHPREGHLAELIELFTQELKQHLLLGLWKSIAWLFSSNFARTEHCSLSLFNLHQKQNSNFTFSFSSEGSITEYFSLERTYGDHLYINCFSKSFFFCYQKKVTSHFQ